MRASAPRIAGLYAIADSAYLDTSNIIPAVRAALDGGARVIQYRDKTSDTVTRQRIARALNALCRERDVPLLINDDVALAAAVGAAGVHIGRDDPGIQQARAALGPAALVGVSCYNELPRAEAAQDAGADYVAFGRFFPSRSKPQAHPAAPELLRTARGLLKIPVVAIGGITPENGGLLIEAGAEALAVIEGVFGQPDVCAAAKRYAQLFSKV